MLRSGSSRLITALACLLLLLGTLSTVSPAAEGGGEATAESHESHAEGVPLDPKKDLALWSGVVFLIFLFVLRLFAWGPITEGLDKREANVRQNIADAETNRRKSERLLAEHKEQMDKVQDQVREILAEARRDADQARQNILSAAEKEAEAMKQRAVSDIERARDAALKDIFTAMADRVTEATEHVLGRTLSDDDQKRLVTEALEQVSAKS